MTLNRVYAFFRIRAYRPSGLRYLFIVLLRWSVRATGRNMRVWNVGRRRGALQKERFDNCLCFLSVFKQCRHRVFTKIKRKPDVPSIEKQNFNKKTTRLDRIEWNVDRTRISTRVFHFIFNNRQFFFLKIYHSCLRICQFIYLNTLRPAVNFLNGSKMFVDENSEKYIESDENFLLTCPLIYSFTAT